MKHIAIILSATLLLSCGVQFCAAETMVLGQNGQWELTTELPEQLALAQQQLEADRPGKAIKTIKKWAKKNADSPEMDQALFIKGKALMARKRYYQAFLVFEELLDEHSATSLFEPVLQKQVAIAEAFLSGEKRVVWGFIRTSARTEAAEILERVVERWPGSELAAKALMIEADCYYDDKRYIDAQETYQLVIDNYTRSQYYSRALLRSAEATDVQYLGVTYDTSCLDDARIRYQQFQLQFPELAREAQISERLARIREQEVAKEFQIADFYRRTGKTDSACWYWRVIIERWPDSQLAQQSRELLREHDSKPLDG